ncbi:A/G-specific adenine glycosylase [Indibacter alkaliphilus]|uniref:A/G-specific adenine glycosylase n=1 Tax=Indibacter alkaliphilus TaxID=579922 RepID=UPI00058FD259|nr:A/G-specific adenine glycosylase [Indibacter alkaliphilus]
MSLHPFVNTLLDWYPKHKRDLPWRNTKDPYIIWLSEIILQQTRVAQGLPYFEKFLENYPKVQDLAYAPIEEIMRHWQGLGYYSRARNLHQCAQIVVDKYQGEFPDSYQELKKLKGIGSYTAAAIASFAFDEPVAVVDGNVFRLLSRYFGISTDIASSAGKREFESLANELVPPNSPGTFNQAIMEFGSLQCTPKSPDCTECPLKEGCFAHKERLVDALPVKINKVKVKERFFQYFHIECGNHSVVKERTKGDIWQGLYDFPMKESASKKEFEAAGLELPFGLKNFVTPIVYESSHIYKHILTHQRIFANFVKFVVEPDQSEMLKAWTEKNNFHLINHKELENLGKPRLILKYLNDEK